MLPLGINQSAQEVQTSFRRSLKDESGELKNIYVEQIAEIPINSGQTMLKVNDQSKTSAHYDNTAAFINMKDFTTFDVLKDMEGNPKRVKRNGKVKRQKIMEDAQFLDLNTGNATPQTLHQAHSNMNSEHTLQHYASQIGHVTTHSSQKTPM